VDREGENLDLLTLSQGDDVGHSVQAVGVFTIAEQHDDPLRAILLARLRELAKTGGEQSVVEVGCVAQLLNPLHRLKQGSQIAGRGLPYLHIVAEPHEEGAVGLRPEHLLQ